MWTVLAGALSTSFTGSSVEIQRTCAKRRFVALQVESAPGPDGLPYSVYRLSTSSSRSNSVRPSFFYGLGHMRGGSDSTNFFPSQSSRSARVACTGLHADLQLLRRVLDFIFGTMKHVPLSRVAVHS